MSKLRFLEQLRNVKPLLKRRERNNRTLTQQYIASEKNIEDVKAKASYERTPQVDNGVKVRLQNIQSSLANITSDGEKRHFDEKLKLMEMATNKMSEAEKDYILKMI